MNATASFPQILAPSDDIFGAHLGASSSEPPSPVQSRPVKFNCADGTQLTGTWFEPNGPARAVAVVNSATGVRRTYYKAFAEWLAQRGYAVLTYDYRGIGESLDGPIRDSKATMLDWGQQDIPAALSLALARDKPLLIIGHSSGGNLLSLAEHHEKASAILVIGSQLAGWRYWPGLLSLGIASYFRLIALASALIGYLPTWILGGGNAAPLPQGVAAQWARWGRTTGYYFGAPETDGMVRPEAYQGPYHAYSISDDVYAPPRAVEALVARHTQSRSVLIRVEPADLGVKAIGHFGPFRRALGLKLWPAMLAKIESDSPTLSSVRW